MKFEKQKTSNYSSHKTNSKKNPGHPLSRRLGSDRAVDKAQQNQAHNEYSTDKNSALEEPEAYEKQKKTNHDPSDGEVGLVLVDKVNEN